MLIMTALFASMLSQYAQGGRIAYVSVKTDSPVFTEGENVTFKFVPLSKDVYFSTSGIDTSSGMYLGINIGSVHIIRIPDSVDPYRIIDDRTLLDKIGSWDTRDMTVSFDFFNSTDGTKSLSWNATVWQYTYNQYTLYADMTYHKALGGYYLIYPQFTSLAGHPVKFQLDRDAIFYLDALTMKVVPSMNGSLLNYNVTVSAPASLTGDSNCTMYCFVSGMGGQEGNGSLGNLVEFDLVSGGSHSMTIQGTALHYQGMDSYQISGWIDTSWGNYTFYRSDWYINGGWYDSPQYYYYY